MNNSLEEYLNNLNENNALNEPLSDNDTFNDTQDISNNDDLERRAVVVAGDEENIIVTDAEKMDLSDLKEYVADVLGEKVENIEGVNRSEDGDSYEVSFKDGKENTTVSADEVKESITSIGVERTSNPLDTESANDIAKALESPSADFSYDERAEIADKIKDVTEAEINLEPISVTDTMDTTKDFIGGLVEAYREADYDIEVADVGLDTETGIYNELVGTDALDPTQMADTLVEVALEEGYLLDDIEVQQADISSDESINEDNVLDNIEHYDFDTEDDSNSLDEDINTPIDTYIDDFPDMFDTGIEDIGNNNDVDFSQDDIGVTD